MLPCKEHSGRIGWGRITWRHPWYWWRCHWRSHEIIVISWRTSSNKGVRASWPLIWLPPCYNCLFRLKEKDSIMKCHRQWWGLSCFAFWLTLSLTHKISLWAGPHQWNFNNCISFLSNKFEALSKTSWQKLSSLPIICKCGDPANKILCFLTFYFAAIWQTQNLVSHNNNEKFRLKCFLNENGCLYDEHSPITKYCKQKQTKAGF